MGEHDRDGLNARLTVLGTGTVAVRPELACAGLHLSAGDVRLLLDCGPGVVERLVRFFGDTLVTHVVITHFHNDHTGDLPFLLFTMRWGLAQPRTTPLVIAGPRGLRDRLAGMAAAFGDHVSEPDFPLQILELDPGDVFDAGPLRISCAPARHMPESICFRVQAGDHALGYTGDTGPDDSVAAFLADVDVLVSECSLPDALAMDMHLTPSGVAALANRARPGRLVLTHMYPEVDRATVGDVVRRAGWAGATLVGRDGLTVELGGAG